MAAHSGSGFDLTPPSPEQRKLLEADLTAEEANVLLRHATEAPFCGAFLDEKRPGVFTCRLCGLPLFLDGQKFESGTAGRASRRPSTTITCVKSVDSSYGMARTELLCARCGSHQGHVFPDGPPPTGLRYCINSVSLTLRPRASRDIVPRCFKTNVDKTINVTISVIRHIWKHVYGLEGSQVVTRD
jgi:peptide-methionine (R)-S-oxide reductase